MITMEMEGWKIDSIALSVWQSPLLPSGSASIFLVQTHNTYLDQIITVTPSIFMPPTPIKTVITDFGICS